MFEKDAEEYRLNLVTKLRPKLQEGCNCKELVDIERAFQKGAEFGYNRANEEHSAEIDVLKRELQAEKTMRQYWHDEYCKAVSRK